MYKLLSGGIALSSPYPLGVKHPVPAPTQVPLAKKEKPKKKRVKR